MDASVTLPPLLQGLPAVLERRAVRATPPRISGRREAGVLVLFYQRAGELHVLFFRRTDRVPTHKNQVAFPGGSRDPEDANLLETALREAREELGVDPSRVSVLGPLRAFDTRINNFVLNPFAGYLLDPDPVFVPQPFEVETVLEIPLQKLRTSDYKHWGLVPGFAVPFPLPFWQIDDAVIWGASGAILTELLDALDEAQGQR